ncbi:MAG: hypothetical protein NT038_05190, partial [Euryarchaeota archaeon]|nr:hypothetical protein [Euryarchaeota archaeon]
MDEKGRIKITSGIDVVVSVVILFVGFIVVLFGNDWFMLLSMTGSSSYSSYSTPNPIAMYGKIPWIILLTGITLVLYGIKR